MQYISDFSKDLSKKLSKLINKFVDNIGDYNLVFENLIKFGIESLNCKSYSI